MIRKESYLKKWIINFGKCMLVASFPIPAVLAIWFIWYKIFYEKNIYFIDDGGIVIGILTITYALFGENLVGKVFFDDLGKIKMAVKQYDLNTFMDLCDEHMSPLIHAVMFMLSGILILAIMSHKYESLMNGSISVSVAAEVLGFIYCAVHQANHPCEGIWQIWRHEEWKKMDPKKWRDDRNKKLQERYKAQIARHLKELEEGKKK